MFKRKSELLIQDIVEAIEKIEEYIAAYSEEQFETEKKTIDAVVRNLGVIGEAADRLPDKVKSAYSQIEWNKIVGLRHRIIHEYFGIDLKIVWSILKNDLPQLKEDLKKGMGIDAVREKGESF